MVKKLYGLEHFEVATVHRNFGKFHLGRKGYEPALEHFDARPLIAITIEGQSHAADRFLIEQEALRIQKIVYGEDHLETARTNFAIATTYDVMPGPSSLQDRARELAEVLIC
eukprot:tig00021312_g20040.t1